MNRELHIARQGMELGVLAERDARALLKAGFLRPDDLYWTEGTADWRPLGEPEDSAPTAASRGTRVLRLAKEKVTSAAATVGDGAASLSRKLRTFAGAGRQQFTESTRRALDDFMPQLRKLVAERMISGPLQAGRRAAHDDAFLRKLFGAVYDCLPRPLCRFVPESAFIHFCMERRNALVYPAGQPSDPPDKGSGKTL